jgi:hypothetical protein
MNRRDICALSVDHLKMRALMEKRNAETREAWRAEGRYKAEVNEEP